STQSRPTTATPLLMECDIAALMLARCGSGEWWMSTRLQRRASSALKPSHGLRGSTGMGSWETADMRDRVSRSGARIEACPDRFPGPVLPCGPPFDDGWPSGRLGTEGDNS